MNRKREGNQIRLILILILILVLLSACAKVFLVLTSRILKLFLGDKNSLWISIQVAAK